MKKQVKKLVLAKETVKKLESKELREIQGGLMVSNESRCAITHADC